MIYELGILGAGNMAEAIVRGVLGKSLFQPAQIIAADPVAARREMFEGRMGVRCITDNAAVAAQSRIILLSTKPYQIQEALEPVGAAMSEHTLVISIAAGVTSRAIAAALDGRKKWRIVRAMPNTPMLVGEGIVGLAAGVGATPQDVAAARRIFAAAAEVIEVREDKIDAVTALSGSGPAYVYFLVECMIRAGAQMGLSPEDAKAMAIKTAVGAGKLLAASSDEPAELRRKVTTPGGTTEAAITHMTNRNWPQIVVEAILAAERRGKELGQ